VGWRGSPGERGVAQSARPATVVPRERSALGEGYPGTLAGRGPTGGTNHGLALTLPGSAVGAAGRAVTHSQAGEQISRPTCQLISSVTRLAYIAARVTHVPPTATSQSV
jgi:hypothetical protein